jgi:hypothetical protein
MLDSPLLDETVPLIVNDPVELFVEFNIAWLPETITPELTVTSPTESNTNCSQSEFIVALAPPITGAHVAE